MKNALQANCHVWMWFPSAIWLLLPHLGAWWKSTTFPIYKFPFLRIEPGKKATHTQPKPQRMTIPVMLQVCKGSVCRWWAHQTWRAEWSSQWPHPHPPCLLWCHLGGRWLVVKKSLHWTEMMGGGELKRSLQPLCSYVGNWLSFPGLAHLLWMVCHLLIVVLVRS